MKSYKQMLQFIVIVIMMSMPLSTHAIQQTKVSLTLEEEQYLEDLGVITMAVDPDWYPYELMDDQGNFIGIAADLVEIVSNALDITFEIVPTADWAETLKISREGKCHLIPFLNKTTAREEWLIFTEPIFVDPNVFVAREGFPFIADPTHLTNKTVALPYGTAMEEFLRRDYPNLEIIHTVDEIEAFWMVENRQADLTLRSLMVASYIIRSEGFFNLKIVGQLPEYTNNLRMGVLKDEVMLRDILNKGIATITPVQREEIINRHVYIRQVTSVNYGLIIGIMMAIIMVVLMIFAFLLMLQRRRLRSDLEKRTKELKNSERRYKELSNKDGLTGIYNRRHFNDVIVHEWNKAIENRGSISLILIDIDHFKKYNDNYGHLAGDDCLKIVASALKATLDTPGDFVARYGGEEFGIILPCTSARRALEIAKKCKNAIDELNIEHAHSETAPHLTVSLGVSSVKPTNLKKYQLLIELADKGLYEAKQSGRNMIRTIHEMEGSSA